MGPSSVFRETYEHYVARIGEIDLAARGPLLGYEMDSRRARINYFHRTYWVGAQGVHDNEGKVPNLSICVILCKYLLMCPGHAPGAGGLVTFKDFKDAAPLVHYFSCSVQREIASKYQGNCDALAKACIALGGRLYEAELSYQLKYCFYGLPKVPVILLFNDAEEEFASQCTVLFERRAEAYLDMESLAMLGTTLAHWLSP